MNSLFLLLGLLGASGLVASGRPNNAGGNNNAKNNMDPPVDDDDPTNGAGEPDRDDPIIISDTVDDPVGAPGMDDGAPTMDGGDTSTGGAPGGASGGGTTSGGPTSGGSSTDDTSTGGGTTTGGTSGGTTGGDTPTPPPSSGGDDDGGSTPQVVIPQGPQQDTGGDGGMVQAASISGGLNNVIGGRVTTLSPEGDDIVALRVTDGVEHGNVTVNPDGTFAVVMTMSDFTGTQAFTYEATHSDGSTSTQTVNLNVQSGLQANGWATGEDHYMLATDEDDRVIVEHGEIHTKVYVSAGSNGLSVAEIAQMEGLSTSQINGSWLANSDYGQSEALALDENAGMMLWETVTPAFSETSNWLLLERGHEYDNLGRILERGAHGEGESNPLYFGAWGEGEKPEVTTEFFQYQESTQNLVVQDIHFSEGILFLDAGNVIFDNIKATGSDVILQDSFSMTVRNSQIVDVFRDDPINGGSNWHAMDDRVQGLFVGHTDGLLLEGLFLDHNGWGDGYSYDADGPGAGQPPTMFSHNIYLGQNLTDVTLRDTISMRAASIGAMVRSGGFIEDNVLLDNNVGINFLGGDYNGQGPTGHYSLVTDNLVTSGAHKDTDMIGARTMGIDDRSELTTLVDNIVAHLADPNNPDELAQKEWTNDSIRTEHDAFYDDTIVYNWQGNRTIYGDTITEQNTEGLDPAALDQTTIQLFAAELLGDPNATIADLADYLRAQGDGAFDNVVDADLIIRFFQEGFGIAPDIRAGAETLRFVPDDLGDGVRWDNRLNWDSDDLPGLYREDSVDLGGNHVVFGTTTTIDTLDMGPGGYLNVYGGRLTLEGGLTGDDSGDLNIEGAGQVWTEGSDANDLDVMVDDAGRFANTGTMQNTDLTANGGQTILATDGAEFDVSAAHTLAISGSDADVGFDGESGGMAILDMQDGSTVAFSAQDGGLGTIEEFRSGAYGDTPNVQSGIDLGNATLNIDLAGLSAAEGNSFTLMDADELVGIFDDAVVGGLGGRNATIVVDYETDSVTLQLSSGNGSVSIQTVGQQSDVTSGEEALWNALTADQGVVSETASVAMEDDEDVEIAA